jgi:hypothetical protein
LNAIFDDGVPGVNLLKQYYGALKQTSYGANLCNKLESLLETYTITSVRAHGGAWYNGPLRTIRIDPNLRPVANTTQGPQLVDPVVILGYEIGHTATKVQDDGPGS